MNPSEGSSELGRLLSGSLAKGEYDSAGEFTVDVEAGFHKLAHSQLPRTTAWLLKIVQAVVSSGAPSLKIQQMRRETLFDFRPPDMSVFDNLEKNFNSHALREVTPIRHLLLGLRAVSIGQGRAFALGVSRGGRQTTYRSNGVSFSRVDSRIKRGVNGVRLSVEAVAKKGRLPSFRSRLTLEEISELERGCQACPIPVTCDGRRLDTLDQQEKKPNQNQAVLALAWRASNESEVLPSFSLPGGVDLSSSWRPTDRLWDKRIFWLDGLAREREVSFVARFSYYYKVAKYGEGENDFEFASYASPSLVHWVLDGVIASSQQLRLPVEPSVRLEVFLSADGLQTDISGLVPLENAERSKRLSMGLEKSTKNLPRLAELLKDHDLRPLSLFMLGRMSFISLHGIAMAIGFKGLTLPIHGLLAYQTYKGMAKKMDLVRQDCLKELRRLQRGIGKHRG